MAKTIETDLRTFVKFWLVPVAFLLVWYIFQSAWMGLVIIGIAIFLALALRPLVSRVDGFFTKHFGKDKKHQNLSAILAYLIVVVVLGAIIAIIGPVVVNETTKFVEKFPQTFETTFGGWDGVNSLGQTIGVQDLHAEVDKALDGLSQYILNLLSNNLVSSVSSAADIIMKVIFVLVLTLLFLLEGPDMMHSLWGSMEDNDNKKMIKVARRTVSKMANVVSTYVSRQVIVAMIDGCATMLIVFIISLIFGLTPSLAIPMGLITALFYLIPMFGQFIGGAIVTVLILFSSPWAGLIYAIVYISYAQVENNIIAPKIQGDALNLRPVMILCAIIIGMYMFNLLGAIIAIPIAGCIRVLVEEFPNFRAAAKG